MESQLNISVEVDTQVLSALVAHVVHQLVVQELVNAAVFLLLDWLAVHL